MEKLYTEAEFLQGQERQLFSIDLMLNSNKVSLADIENIIPGVIHTNDSKNLSLKFISESFCRIAGFYRDDFLRWSVEDYFNKIVHPVSKKIIFKLATSLSTSNNIDYVQGYFQKARPFEGADYELYFSNKKLLSDSLTITISHPMKNLGTIVNKLERVLDDNYFLRKHYKQFASLSKKEVEILKLIVTGVTRKNISELLNISVQTYDTHRKNIKKKLEVKSYKDLYQYAESFGLI